MAGRVVIVLMFFLLVVKAAAKDVGLIKADMTGRPTPPDHQDNVFCLAYNPSFHPLPATYDGQVSSPLANYSGHDGCSDIYSNIKGKVVAVGRGNCTFAEKAALIENRGGVAALIVDYANDSSLLHPGGNSSEYNAINITVAIMRHNDFAVLLEREKNLKVWMYSPDPPPFDPNNIVMFTLACVCVTLGAYLSAKAGEKKRGQKKGKKAEEEKEEDNLSLGMGVTLSIAVVVFLCVTLTLLYFFYDYLVYVIIAIFCFAGTNTLFYTFLPLWKKVLPFEARLPLKKFPCMSRPPQLRSLLLWAMSAGFVVTWFVFRHQSFAWILQDIIGFCFCLHVMHSLRMPSLKACTILLCLLFFYDIFFVFLTPLFTKDGVSIMVKVATGGSSTSGEQMPTVFKVPYLLSWAMGQCLSDRYSLLGYGDVIVPGLLITYNCAFDLRTKDSVEGRWKLLYFWASSVGYYVGLAVTEAVLFAMKSGQPALLYLVPCTLLPTVIIAACRKELALMWRGQQCLKKDDDSDEPSTAEDKPPGTRELEEGEDDEDGGVTTERQSLIQ